MDLSDFLTALSNQLYRDKIFYNNPEWLSQCKQWKDDYPLEVEQTDKVSLYHFYQTLSENLRPTDIVVLGSSGSVNEVANQGALKIYHKGTRVIQAGGLGSMGFGLAESIGVSIASKKPVICMEGDGSFAMNMQELATVKALNLPILIFILNNSGYVSINNSQNNLCQGRLQGVNKDSGLYLPDYKKIAKSYDIKYISLDTNDSVTTALSQLLIHLKVFQKPIICELFGNSNHKTLPRTQTYIDDSGKLCSGKLEEMYPPCI